jgi:hypothetical protein
VVPQSCWDSDEQTSCQHPKSQLDHNPWRDGDREHTEQTDPQENSKHKDQFKHDTDYTGGRPWATCIQSDALRDLQLP